MSADEALPRPLISVVVPTFNDGHHLGEALASITAQARDDIEVVIVDDGSDTAVDATIAAALPRACVITQANAGPSGARNRGIRASNGEFVAFLDADDLWEPNALSRLVKGFADAPAADIVHGHVRRFHDGEVGRQKLGPIYCGFNVGSLMVRREVLTAAGLFDESLRRSEDVDLIIRLRDAGARRVVIPDLILNYRAAGPDGQQPSGHALKPVANGNWISLLRSSLQRKRTARQLSTTAEEGPTPVSVILTVRNGMRYLPAGLASVRRQTSAPAEIIACVGPSTDGTLDYLAGEPDVSVVRQCGEGLAHARNEALPHASHPFIAFFDHDDLWHPEKLAKQLEALSVFARPSACIVNFLEITDDASADGMVTDPPQGLPTLGWTPSAVVAHRDVYQQIGPFDPALGMGCDTDWFDRLRRSDIPCTVAGRALLWKRRHERNLSSDPLRNREAMFKVIRKRQLLKKLGGG
ncbi:MAG: glycosyltransferase family A protein [Pseudomonadota bacterium]